jgi:hypothetical protein
MKIFHLCVVWIIQLFWIYYFLQGFSQCINKIFQNFKFWNFVSTPRQADQRKESLAREILSEYFMRQTNSSGAWNSESMSVLLFSNFCFYLYLLDGFIQCISDKKLTQNLEFCRDTWANHQSKSKFWLN